ncbi:ankyrin repeat domain-containing protein 45 [Trichosurus vulpecula]|uniref:ankyrin repeat domain-containing protein 45 n=1 Tax=Trichosurus vulpecula TaxID=9337 RepID=UPI00186B31E7|nr:ankyrin repeat domain-containing protein 45 [Trichosurus vulpecula]
MVPLLEPEPSKEAEIPEEQETSEESENISSLESIIQHILTGNIEKLKKIFEDPENPSHSKVMQLVLEEDVIGRNFLYAACMVGQSDLIRMLAQCGVNLNEKTARGYTLLHCAAAWGQVETLKTLVDLEVDIEALNFRNETARDVALRYSQTECVDYLDFAVAHLALKKSIAKIQAIITDPEKAPGKMNKEDKNLLMSACRAKMEWLELHAETTKEELLEQKQQLEDLVNPILVKMATPREY